MKIVIPGGTGQVGVLLARMFHGSGHEVTVLSRRAIAAPWRVVQWDAETRGDWTHEFDGADAVINLAGRSVNCRYTPENRREILESRVNSARVVGEAIQHSRRPPKVWLQASTATIYAHRYDNANDEMTGIIGGGEPGAPDTWKFSIDVAEAWERVVDETETPHTRRVKMRSSIIMSPDKGGPFDVLLGLVRHGLGGKSGSGDQYVSWIHDYDFIRAVCWLIEHPQFEGPVNLAAPEPLPNAEFMHALRAAWGTKFGFPAAAWMLEIGALFLKTETELILKSRRVIPSRLLREGFEFEFPRWPEAAYDLTQRWKAGRK
ncbi:NAD-dependent epimerase [Capsulimonas corticalis]|uniref:NAD-dependent epimerase n=1 Tax=Capsulimonas corticalis TaxID=2219043 RepID=A0A402CVB2_9BACT|nr:TIGR01777 family oxidoreductase [Capsulimonas corticalis]BDI30348.1 NAD-dependent epimerase [Capsulimonas corticalis]